MFIRKGASHVFATLKRLAPSEKCSSLSLRSIFQIMARPALKEEDKRVVQVNIRLTEAEHNRVNTYAEAAGITPANWIRQKVFTGKFPQIKVSPLDAAVYRELHKIGVNLNQAVKAMHTGKQPNLITIIGSLLSQQKEIIKMLIP